MPEKTTRETATPRAATPEQVDQQRRIIMQTQSHVHALLIALDSLTADQTTYDRLGLADDLVLSDDAFSGTGTTKAAYRAAIVSIEAIFTLLETGHGTNLETFAR